MLTNVVLFSPSTEQSDGFAFPTGTCCSPCAVRESLRVGRRVVLQDHVHVGEVDSAGRDVRAEKYCWRQV